jgi:hypothetical protein
MTIRNYLNEISQDLYGVDFNNKSLHYSQKALILRTQEKVLIAMRDAYDEACRWENPQ